MMWILFKLLMTSGMVVLISEVAKRSDRLGGAYCGPSSCHCSDFNLAVCRKATGI